MMKYNFLFCGKISFFVYVIFFQFKITWFFCNVLFCNIRKLIWLITYLDLLSLLICLILFWLLLFLLVSLLVCLLTLSLSFSIKHLCLFFHLLPILTDILKIRPPVYFDSPPLIKFNRDLRPHVYFDNPFIRHLRVANFADIIKVATVFVKATFKD